jgi:integrase
MASIDKRPDRPDSPWRLRWREYPGGPQKTKHFRRKIDADNFRKQLEHSLMVGTYVDPAKGRTTVADYYAAWFARQPWRESSRASVGSMFENHVLPVLGARPLGSIRRGDIESWAVGLSLGGRTARLAVQYLGTMLEAAVEDGLLAVNPVRNAKRPRVEAEPVVPYTAEELDRLWTEAPEWFRGALTLGAMCGLRQSEATGLTVDRLDLMRRTLVVDRQLVTPPAGEPAFGPPKTSTSYRTVPLADVARDSLVAHLERFGPGEHGLVIHEDGRPVRRQRFGKVWRSLRKRAELPESAVFHGCRHTYASNLLSGGVSVAAAAEYLGHTPAVLLKTYAHLMPADHDRARAVVQAAFAAEDRLRTEDTL